jgi:hypothetical protein
MPLVFSYRCVFAFGFSGRNYGGKNFIPKRAAAWQRSGAGEPLKVHGHGSQSEASIFCPSFVSLM